MSGAIFIRGLALHAFHGVLPYEAKVGQTFKLDLVISVDLSAASRTDKLADTIDYGMLVDFVAEVFRSKRYRLIEAAAGGVANAILDRYPRISEVQVTVHKPHAPIAASFEDVGITITRSRNELGRG